MPSSDLINTLEAPGEFDALTSIRPGEPYFLLVGRDRQAPKLVQQWADTNRRRAFKDHSEGRISDEELERELRKSTDAERIGWAMESYKRGDAERPPTAERSATVKASEMPEETRKRDALQSARSRTSSVLNEAVAEVVALLFLLGDFDDPNLDVLAEECRSARDIMDALSNSVKPWRPIGIAGS